MTIIRYEFHQFCKASGGGGASQVRSERKKDLPCDKIPLQTLPINKAFETYEDQCPDQCNVKRLKGSKCALAADQIPSAQ